MNGIGLQAKRLVDIQFVQIMLLAFSYVLELMFLVKYDFLEWVGLTILTMHEFYVLNKVFLDGNMESIFVV